MLFWSDEDWKVVFLDSKGPNVEECSKLTLECVNHVYFYPTA